MLPSKALITLAFAGIFTNIIGSSAFAAFGYYFQLLLLSLSLYSSTS